MLRVSGLCPGSVLFAFCCSFVLFWTLSWLDLHNLCWFLKDCSGKAWDTVSPLQKNADHAVVVAVSFRAVFESGSDDVGDVYAVGVAFPLMQVKMNVVFVYVEKLLLTIASCLKQNGVPACQVVLNYDNEKQQNITLKKDLR